MQSSRTITIEKRLAVNNSNTVSFNLNYKQMNALEDLYDRDIESEHSAAA